MNHQRLLPPPTDSSFPCLLFLLYLLLFVLPPCFCSEDNSSQKISDCRMRSRPCGDRSFNISYPFRYREDPSHCGVPGLELSCEGNTSVSALTISIGSKPYNVIEIDYTSHFLTVVDLASLDPCFWPSENITLDTSLFIPNTDIDFNITFLDCSRSISIQNFFHQVKCPSVRELFRYWTNGSVLPEAAYEYCELVRLPINKDAFFDRKTDDDISEALQEGFTLNWAAGIWQSCSDCLNTTGVCVDEEEQVCYCPNDIFERGGSCNRPNGRRTSWKNLAIGIPVGGSGVLLVSAVLLLSVQKRSKSRNTRSKSRNTRSIKDFLNEYGSLAPKRYRYSDLKKITKSFRKKLGEGGYGSVFEGKLQDGRSVAVKILNKSREDGADFINEVASIGRTSHVNIVTLLGFCLDGRKRALVYEYMPNGSLDKYIYSDDPKALLPWDKLYQIAIGIARGLEYLHRGCNTRIVHFDIKPHNILLNEDFCPKISDFGLAKLCPQRESLLSMAGARGTIGYIAPEVVSRCFGVASTKSDVYSYGMMVLEMAGGRRNVKAGADRSSEVYFPHWVYEHLDRDGDLEAYGVTVETEEIARKMILVGLRCVQTAPADRPSMSRVVEMLEGSVTDVEMPPKPYPSSPGASASVLICPLSRVTDSS